MAQVTSKDPLLNGKQAAEYLNIAPGTLGVWRSTGRYNLPFIKMGARVRYRLSELDAFIESRSRVAA